MDESRFNPKHQEVLDSLLLEIPGVRTGNIMGLPAYYIAGKLFAFLDGGGVVVKVSKERASELVKKSSAVLWRPSAKPKAHAWVHITHQDSHRYLDEEKLFHEAIRFTTETSLNKSEEQLCLKN